MLGSAARGGEQLFYGSATVSLDKSPILTSWSARGRARGKAKGRAKGRAKGNMRGGKGKEGKGKRKGEGRGEREW